MSIPGLSTERENVHKEKSLHLRCQNTVSNFYSVLIFKGGGEGEGISQNLILKLVTLRCIYIANYIKYLPSLNSLQQPKSKSLTKYITPLRICTMIGKIGGEFGIYSFHTPKYVHDDWYEYQGESVANKLASV